MGTFSPEESREIKEMVARILPEGNSGALTLDCDTGRGIASIHIPLTWTPTLSFDMVKTIIKNQLEAKILEATVCKDLVIDHKNREMDLMDRVSKAEVYKNHFQLEYLLKYQQFPDLR